ncbi:xanthine dehydrogenase/oxidase [Folsomia candida]|uniref:xanthine dehydrogenase/oxidase n=1 Tax=Folsomia candida TaxID=158441 RepID=UPI000B905385|nr:xanthine dehydrogenase/oxidase [Folsomia candida]
MIPKKTSSLIFYVNGQKIVDENVNPEWTLLTYLRNKLRLTGSKLGCGEGGCGACTVMLSRFDRDTKKIVNFAVNACLTPICSVHGSAVITVEGIGNVANGLHPVQERIAKSHGSQCGFCTPGIVMSMYTLMRNNSLPSMHEVEVAFQGNLCRCTGYRPILEGYKTLTKEGAAGGCCGKLQNGGCCMQNGTKENGTCTNGGDAEEEYGLFNPNTFKKYDPSTEFIFPPELQLTSDYDDQYLVFNGERVTWYRPTSLGQLLELKAKYPYAKIVVGNTEIGVEVKFKNCLYPVIIQPTRVPELVDVKLESKGVRFGSAVTLSDMETVLREQIATQPEYKTRVFSAIVEMLRWFAGKQIRNVAAIGGNIMTGSPISDLNPLFMAAGCELELKSKDDHRVVTMDDTFFTGYRKNICKSEEILQSILIPYLKEDEYFWGFKQAKRRDDDIAIVNAGMFVRFEVETNTIQKISLAFGGMAPTTVMARTTQSSLVKRQWNQHIVQEAAKTLIEDLPLDPSAPGGMIEFRRSLTLSFFFKFYMIVQEKLNQRLSYVKPLPSNFKSAIQVYHRGVPKSSQISQIVPSGQPDHDLVGKPIPHMSGMKQATGEAIYVDDMPKFENELYLALVFSSRAHAKLISVDATEALQQEGVVDFISAKDIPKERNKMGAIIHDEEIFASKTVTCIGQPIGAILAHDQATAQRASKMVKAEYQDIKPLIITIQDAIKHNSFYQDWIRNIKNGNIEKGFSESDHILEGDMHLGGQEHFYLETQATIALPKLEDGETEIFCSTQNPTEIQLLTAEALGVPANRIVVRTKRMGGGFGGKETRSMMLAIPVALAANKLKRPVRCMFDRDEDMGCSGTRHPFFCRFKVGVKNDGRVMALKMTLYNNGGNSLDLSCSVMERALFSADNAYNIPNVDFTGYVCKTNLPSNTAFRGFGGPQGMMFTENVFDQIADKLNIDPIQLREINMYKEGDETHYNQPLEYCTIPRCWSECKANSEFAKRRQEVDAFNAENRWKKRGISLIPTKFGIAFTALFLNQAGALVMVYRDGSVLISHGGTEMGQGLHTKMIQVASRAMRISSDKIHIMETSTDKVPNTSPTAASAGSDLNGMAVLNACNQIMERLEPYITAKPKGRWEDWVTAAYFDRVGLSVAGFYKTPGIGFDFKAKLGKPFNYFCFGAACAEVEIDCLTGDHEVRRCDIVMDVGESINPAIDIGQIEGGYMQGYGLYTLEELRYSPQGHLLTKGPGMYKLPGFGDIPEEFNVSLLRGAPNAKAVFSSKAVGEPPLFLAAAAFYGIKDAIKSARKEQSITGPFRLDSPATAERIRMACIDQFTEKFPTPASNTFKPWSVTV